MSAVVAIRPRPVELPEQVPARMLNEFVYCPRLFLKRTGFVGDQIR
jgi:hypothetical protein